RVRKLHGRIAVSKSAMEFASTNVPAGRYEIIPNGIDIGHFSPDVLPFSEFCDDKLNILFVGRLESRKGLKYLLQAFRYVKAEVPKSRLIVVGPGTRLRKGYEKQVARDHLTDVVFVGYASYEELPRYYKTADIFCAPATGRESFGIVLLEAMAVGKPIVASNIEGYAGVVTHGADGLLVPPRDEKALAKALLSLMADESLREQMGARGRLKAMDYSWEHVSRRVLEFYRQVLKEHGRSDLADIQAIPV
ncbi:MAG: glycosyltransferase family 4 protein, partial [Dehalococcoidales bacterium]|nr:glycosyltransferase family 4 protein [Dehalococcoidales bacterium]